MIEKPQALDIDAARKLADDLSIKLSQLPAGSERIQELRAEVESLRAALNGSASRPASDAGVEHSWVAEKLRSIEGVFEHAAVELLADGVKASMYLSEIGRILGMR